MCAGVLAMIDFPDAVVQRSCAVAGAARYALPGLFVKLVQVFLDRKFLAARRAAQGYRPSADLEHHVLAARPALHCNLKKTVGRGQRQTQNNMLSFRTPHSALDSFND